MFFIPVALGARYAEHMARSGGYITRDDLTGYRTVTREPVRGVYRGFEIIGPPPPSSGPLHIIQMLNILEGYDIGALGFGSPQTLHLLAEALKIAFADRAAATADPAFVRVPVEKLLSKVYAAERRKRIDRERAQTWVAEVAPEGVSLHHSSDRGGFGRQRGGQHADDQQPIWRTLYRSGYRHDPEQLHVCVRSASGTGELGGSRQARHFVDVSGDRGAGR